MKYIRTYDTEERFLADKDDNSRGFRLKPVLYKYSEARDHIHLELDDPRKHGDSTYMEINLSSDTEFSFYIGNTPDDTQTIRDCKVDWGDGDSGSTRLTADDKGFKLSHNYKAGSYSIELYAIEDYSITGDATNYESLISHPSSIKRVVLSSGVVNIGAEAFDKCSSLTSINIPESVTSIGTNAFKDCSSLISINIPESVTSIGTNAFFVCSSLTSVYIPESVTSIGKGAFSNCTSLTSINIPEGVTSIESSTFIGCPFTSIHIPESVTSIGGYAFYNCKSLKSTNIPEGVTSIRDMTFYNCSSLTSVNIPEGVTSIQMYAFYKCAFTSIRIPEGVTRIREHVFEKCSSLTSISSLNPTAPTLGSGAFSDLPTNGTLYIKPGATGYDAWLNALPSGWKIVESL